MQEEFTSTACCEIVRQLNIDIFYSCVTRTSIRKHFIWVYTCKNCCLCGFVFRMAHKKATVAQKLSHQSRSNFPRSFKRYISSWIRKKTEKKFCRHVLGFRVDGHICIWVRLTNCKLQKYSSAKKSGYTEHAPTRVVEMTTNTVQNTVWKTVLWAQVPPTEDCFIGKWWS